MNRAFTEYEAQLAQAANTLIAVQRIDGGWGLRPTSVSSIVNTAEVLVVMRAAGQAGAYVENGIAFLLDGLPVFFRDEPTTVGGDGGRGRHIRYISFFLDGLLTYPEHAFSDKGLDRISTCLDWLDRFPAHRGGIPETMGSNKLSIHQTARVLTAVSRLLVMDEERRELPVNDRNTATRLADAASTYLQRIQGPSGAWPLKAEGGAWSAAKTALATTALGYFARVRQSEQLDVARRRGGAWLMANYEAWRSKTSRDQLEQSTDWVHLDYAECVRGVLAGTEDGSRQLSRSWNFMTKQWSDEERLWYEPASDIGNVTIRAAYHTVMAFESAKASSTLLQPAPLSGPQIEAIGAIRRIRIEEQPTQTVMVIEGTKSTARVRTTTAQHRLIAALEAHPEGLSSEALAKALKIGVGSVPMYVSRLNNTVMASTRGQVRKLVAARRLPGGHAVYAVGDAESG